MLKYSSLHIQGGCQQFIDLKNISVVINLRLSNLTKLEVAILVRSLFPCPGRLLGTIGGDPSVSKSVGYMLTSFGFSLLN